MATRRRVAATLLAVTVAAAGMVGLTHAPATAQPAWPQHPDNDAFYAQPDPMPDVEPGTVLDSRPVQIRALAIPVPFQAWQVKYLSTDTRGEPQANVATIIQPLSSPAKRTLVSYQTAYDGLSADCAPSYAFATGIAPPFYEEAAMLPLLLAGHTVVSADYEGPEYQWGRRHQLRTRRAGRNPCGTTVRARRPARREHPDRDVGLLRRRAREPVGQRARGNLQDRFAGKPAPDSC